MGYYGMLALVFVIMMFSVIVQGKELFSDAFFVVSYITMGMVLFIGTKFARSSKTSISMGMLLIFSVGFLSTQTLIDFLTKPSGTSAFFKLAIIGSLDVCAIYFLRYGREFRKEESKSRRIGPYDVKGKYPEEGE
jgi:hypothetical protein